MTTLFEEKFLLNNDSNWSNVTNAGGPITVTDERKRIADGGVTADQLGFWGKVIDSGVTLAGKIVQVDMFMEADTTTSIGVVGVSNNPGLDYVNAVNFNYNSFPSPRFVFFDYGGFQVTGSQILHEFNVNARYTLKFQFVSGDLVRAYITRYPDLINFPLGVSVLATDFSTGPIYFSMSQTSIVAATKTTVWDNIYVHDEGLNFVVPEFQGEVDTMIASRTEIANLALRHIGIGKAIGNIDTENSEEARAARRYYDIALESTFRDFDWPFATKYQSLGLVEENPNTEWVYSYRYPADCLKIRKILSSLANDNRQSRIDFVEAQDSSGKLIFTNAKDAVVKYTPFTNNVSIYPPDFIRSFSFRLAADMAPSLTAGDPFAVGDKALGKYGLELSRAQANAGNEEQEEEHPESEYIRARL
jgi:hypothetical protein